MERTFVFQTLPRNVEELRALPEFALSDPFMTAALTVAALCRYEADPNAAVEMLNACTITVRDDPYSYQNEGYARLQLQSFGADSLRPVTLRRKGEQWMLWDQMLLADIRTPAKDDPWA